ncbi:hypothetical protein [uncultured Thiothrix sp.]|uniref:hypothetical protein n=1 Tax=uncultured Thiothrix sp. TaxID=223185 RepID=UPI002622CCB9|nr:hypothetical protein [uncultured Thiothrix sp.]HMT93332.1 hypothetical protein [Thiolinea sp.]
MNNPYKTPQAILQDLSYQPLPPALKTLYWLMGLAFSCSFISTTIGFVNVVKAASWIFLLPWTQQLMLLGLAGSGYALLFAFYYFLVFRPLQLRRRTTSRWWLIAVLILALLWLWFVLLPDDNPQVVSSMVDVSLAAAEIGLLILGGLLAARPAALEHLTN